MRIELKPKLNTVLILLGAVAAAAGCSSANPLPRTPGQPAPITILGVNYTVPARLDVPDFELNPGRARMIFKDNVTRCEGAILIESVGDVEAHEAFIKDATRDRESMFMKAGLTVNTETEPYSIWSTQGRLTSLFVSHNEESIRHSILDVHSQARQLSLVSEIVCEDPGLMDQQVKAIAGFADSAEFNDDAVEPEPQKKAAAHGEEHETDAKAAEEEAAED